MTTISACMMVKNEEELLPQCLESIKDIVDEIIVVDTGSTDRTVEIAKRYGAKVYHHPWENDFSKHRNQSISYATGDWFLIIDADERLEKGNFNKDTIKKGLASLSEEVHVLLARVEDYDRKGKIQFGFRSTRLFRNNVGVHYKGIVHNQAIVSGEAFFTDLVISHFGYDLANDRMEAKFNRTRLLLEERLRKNPEDCEAHLYLANLYGKNKDCEPAIKYGKKCLRYFPEKYQESSALLGIYYLIGSNYLILKDYDNAQYWLKKGLESLPDDVDLFYGLIVAGMKTRNTPLFKKYASLYLEHIEKYRSERSKGGFRNVFHLDRKYEETVRYNLFIINLASENYAEVHSEWSRVKKIVLSHPEYHFKLLKKLAVKKQDALLLEATIELFKNDSTQWQLTSELIKRIPDSSYLQNRIDHFIDELKSVKNEFELCKELGRELVNIGAFKESVNLLSRASRQNSKDEEMITHLALSLSKIDQKEKATQVYLAGYNENMALREFYVQGARHFHRLKDDANARIFLSRLLEKTDSYDYVPGDILFMILQTTLVTGELDYGLELFSVLLEREGLSIQKEVDKAEELARLCQLLADVYMKSGRFEIAEIAVDTALIISGTPSANSLA